MGLQGPLLSPFLQMLTGVTQTPSFFIRGETEAQERKDFLFFCKLFLLGLSPWKKLNVRGLRYVVEGNEPGAGPGN